MNAGPLLADVLDMDLLATMLRERYVLRTRHPHLPLSIFNYGVNAMYDRVWNDVTMTCRGLVVDDNTTEILARPFRKFFNHNQPEASQLPLAGPVNVTDKADGSLGILYPTGNGEYAVATRGSFASEQALHATDLWQRRYAGRWQPPDGYTALFEIVYPGNRVVLDYGQLDDLILLGFVHTRTGSSSSPRDRWHGWTGPVVEAFPFRSYAEALAAEPRENAEGLVVHFIHTDERVKIKQEDYLYLHGILTNCTARKLWLNLAARAVPKPPPGAKPNYYATLLHHDPTEVHAALAQGDNWLHALLADTPDEFHTWVNNRIADMVTEVAQLRAHILGLYVGLMEEFDGDRRAIGIACRRRHPDLFGAILPHADGRDINAFLWKQVCPGHEKPFMVRDEAAA